MAKSDRKTGEIVGNGAAVAPAGGIETILPNEVSVFGHRLHPMRKPDLLDLIFQRRSADEKLILASSNLHGMYMLEKFPEYRALHAQSNTRVIVDGMPLIWLLKLLGYSVSREYRTTWMDWFDDALERAVIEKRRVFVLGHDRAVLEFGMRKAKQRWPGFDISGRDGFFDLDDPSACASVVAEVNAQRPDILFVGMGMPRQEIFVARYGHQLHVPVIGLGGAAFSYFAGGEAVPPRWMGRTGLEWSHRLLKDPRRLTGRYFVEPFLLAAALSQRWHRERRR